MKIYFAHSKRIYDCPAEAAQIQLIRRVLPGVEVINPNGMLPDGSDWWKVAYQLIDDCDAVVFSEHHGWLGKGVWQEVAYAQRMGYPTYLLRDGVLHFGPVEMEVLDYSWVKYARVV